MRGLRPDALGNRQLNSTRVGTSSQQAQAQISNPQPPTNDSSRGCNRGASRVRAASAPNPNPTQVMSSTIAAIHTLLRPDLLLKAAYRSRRRDESERCGAERRGAEREIKWRTAERPRRRITTAKEISGRGGLYRAKENRGIKERREEWSRRE